MKYFLLFTLILLSPQAWASDPTGLLPYLFLISFGIACLLSGLVWAIGKMIGMNAIVKFFLVLPFASLVPPVPLWTQDMPLPSMLVLLGGGLVETGMALISMAFYMLVFYGMRKVLAKFEDIEQTEQLQIKERIRKSDEKFQIEAIKEKTKGLK